MSTTQTIPNYRALPDKLCLACGACVGICAAGAIELSWTDRGVYQPKGDPEKCKNCGMCAKVCPAQTIDLPDLYRDGWSSSHESLHREALVQGGYGWACEESLHKDSQSGGLVTALLDYLLDHGIVDRAVDQISFGAAFANDILGYAHDFTYLLWAQAPASAPATTQYPLSKYYKAEVRFNPEGSTTIQIWSGANLWATIPNSLDGAFHHFVILRRGETIELWYDGEMKKTDTDPSQLVAMTENDLRLGVRFNDDGPYQGAIDDFRMYGRALSAVEIGMLFGIEAWSA